MYDEDENSTNERCVLTQKSVVHVRFERDIWKVRSITFELVRPKQREVEAFNSRLTIDNLNDCAKPYTKIGKQTK